MNWDRVPAQWKQLKGKIKSKWGRLTDDGLDVIAGQNDQPIGKIPERYGLKKDEAQKQVEEWNATLAHEKRGPNRSRAQPRHPPRWLSRGLIQSQLLTKGSPLEAPFGAE